MDFPTAIQTFFRKYSDFSGRASRSEYWWAVLFIIFCSIATGVIDGVFFAESELEPIGTLQLLITLLPNIAVSARRLHDIGKSGWWLLLNLLVLIGPLIIFVWSVKKGTEDDNPYGENPLNTADYLSP